MRRIVAFVLMACVLLSSSAATQEREQQIDDYVREQMAKLRIPGVAIVIVRNGEVQLKRGYGLANVEQKTQVTPETMFQIASTTKPFTAMAIMALSEDGKLSLDERATKYLPWLPSLYADVTVRQLLTHTSGVNRDVRTANVDNFTLDEFKRRFSAAPASFKPGERWEYSNNGYILLGMIVEAVSGKPFGEFLTERFFKPLGMRDTRFNEPPGKEKNRALGYEWHDNAYQLSPYFTGGYAAGALVSSAADLAKWERALNARKSLKQSSFEQMWTPASLNANKPLSFDWRKEQSGYGFGWFLTSYEGRKLFTHGGVLSGFSAVINRFIDDRVTIIVLANSKAGVVRLGYAEILANGIADIYFRVNK